MNQLTVFNTTLPVSYSLEAYKKLLADFHNWLDQIFEHQHISHLVKARARFIDSILLQLWQEFGLTKYPDLSLVAVGGYGRGELHPYSDIDLLLLTTNTVTDAQQEPIASFFTALWDLRLEVGHSVRTVAESISLGKEDVTIATNLMETRLLAGNKILYNTLKQEVDNDTFWSSQDFFQAKRAEQQQRHAQYHGTAYNLEPNLKANPGGLRDIQTIGWVAKKHFHTRTMQELVDHQYLTEDELQELQESEAYLWKMRFALHMEAGRNENRLLFDYQPAVAKRLGFGDSGKIPVERMMKRFFLAMQRVSELNEMLLQHFEVSILNQQKQENAVILDDYFAQQGHLISARFNAVFSTKENFLRLFWHIANNPEITGIHSPTIRLIRLARRRLMGDLQDYEACRQLFLSIFRHPNGMGRAITLMHKHGILAAYLPQWRNIVGQMQFDLFHAYTVDEHTHRVLKNLYRYSQPEHEDEFPLCSDLVRQMEKPELLYLAGIFHDIAKGRGGDHSELGAMDVREFAKLHRLSEFDGKLLAWLVEHHLLMSVTAQRRDIHDPQVITEFAEIIRDEIHLNYLYCFTLADIRATNDTLWNDWKGSLLRELYLITQKALRRGLEKPLDMYDLIQENQATALSLLSKRFSEQDVRILWDSIKSDYFIRYSPAQIAWHTEHILRHQPSSSPLVLISKSPIRGGTQVFVYTQDRENLFARLVSALDSKKVDIFDAQIMTNKDGYVMDTFVILEQNGEAVSSPCRLDDIRLTLTQYINQDIPPLRQKTLLSRQIRPFNVAPNVQFIADNNYSRSMIEITALDTPGLLADIGEIFQQSHVRIHAAKITTIGERAEDFFTISTPEDTALDTEQQNQLKLALINKLTQAT